MILQKFIGGPHNFLLNSKSDAHPQMYILSTFTLPWMKTQTKFKEMQLKSEQNVFYT